MIAATLCSPPVDGGFKGLWYLAHPYSGDEDANVADSLRVMAECYRRGYETFNPLAHTPRLCAAYPDLEKARGRQMWYDWCLRFIHRTYWDGLILCPGWEDSHGCRLEWRAFILLQQKARKGGSTGPRILELASVLAEPVDPRFEE